MMPRHFRSSSRRTTAGLIAALLTVPAVTGVAYAYWSSRGAATAAASTGTLNPATGVTAAAPSLASASVSWTPPTAPGSGGSLRYYVERTTGTTTVAACGTSAGSTIATTSCTDSGVPSGSYTYSVVTIFNSWTARSAASNTVTVNTVPAPTVTLTSPANGSTTNVRTPTFGGTASDNAAVTITLVASGQANMTYTTPVTGTASPYSFSFTPSAALVDGTYTATAKQTNTTGTGTSAATTFLVDGTAPSPTINAVGTTNATGSTTPTLTGTAGTQKADSTHSADIINVKVDIYNGTSTSGNKVQAFTNVAVNGTTGAWSVTPTGLTANAQYTVVVVQGDAAGNSGTASRTFLVDTTPPTIGQPSVNGFR